MISRITSWIAPLALAAALLAVAPRARAEGVFSERIKPFLEQSCVACHSEQTPTSGVAFDGYADEAAALEHPYVWEDVKEQLVRGAMPPEGFPRPEPELIETVVKWIDERLEEAAANLEIDPGRVTARRLNRAEYNNTVRDVLGVDLRPADEFPVDDSGYGFDNIGDVLTVSPVLMEKYLTAAGRVARAAIWTDNERRIPKPTVIRYQQARREGGQAGQAAVGETVDYDPTGRLRIEHFFPAAGDYKIKVSGGDRRPIDRSGFEPGPHPALLGFFVNGVQTDAMYVRRAGTTGYIAPIDDTFRITAGKHELRAEFIDSERGFYDPNIDFEKRLLWADYIEIEGPYNAEPPPLPESHKRIVECSPEGAAEQDRCAKRILSKLARQAYRRPVAPEEVDKLLRFVQMAREAGAPFEEGLQTALQAMLVSPHFLFRIERDPEDPDSPRRIGDYELASRLSYFLWSSMPDDELLSAAGRGDLGADEGLKRQISRMLADEKSGALIENFAGQWLELRNLDRVNPDPELFPVFDDGLRKAMRKETELFFESLLREDRSVLDFLDAPYTFVNERLAKHYGIEGVTGREFRKVEVDGNRRGGILSHASVLTVSSYPTRTSPVLRGVWVLENILASPPPPPPPDVPELDEGEIGQAASLREKLEQHRSDPSCAVCHNKMDNLGFGLENYDPIGRWREADGKFPVDASGELPGGLQFKSPGELKRILRDSEGDRFARALTEKMLTYALGRGLERYDTPAVKQILERLAAEQYRFSALIAGIVESPPFQMRRGEGVRTDD